MSWLSAMQNNDVNRLHSCKYIKMTINIRRSITRHEEALYNRHDSKAERMTAVGKDR